MKYFHLLISFFIPFCAMSQEQITLNDLQQLTWKNRVILVFSDKPDYYKTILEKAQSEIDDRDIVWFIIDSSQTSTNYSGNITDQFTPNIHSQFSAIENPVILIGKDGDVKETSDLLSLESLFDEIDSMPMRINEMNERSAGNLD